MQGQNQRSFENILLSATVVVAGKTVVFPIDRVKLLKQNEGEILISGRLVKPYTGYRDIVRRVYQTEGLRMFWRGNLINIIGFFSTQALNFALKDAFQVISKPSTNDSNSTKFFKNVASGVVAGIITITFVYPFGYTSQRLATDIKMVESAQGGRQFKGIIDVYRKTLQKDGFVGLYRGFVIAFVGLCVYRGLQFGIYDTFKPARVDVRKNLAPTALFAYFVALLSGLTAYPFDTVRRRMMMRSCQAVKYNGSIDCFLQILKREGFTALYKGVGASVVSGVATGSIMVGLDAMKQSYVQAKLRKD